MRAQPVFQSVPIEEVLDRVREAFASHPPATFGVFVTGKRMYWRDAISRDTGAVATLPSDDSFVPTVNAVWEELQKLRAEPGAKRKPPRQEERRAFNVGARTGTAHGRRTAARPRL